MVLCFLCVIVFSDLDGDCSIVVFTDNAATNKPASSSTSLNTKRLDEDTENLAREYCVCAYRYTSLLFISFL
jgi:hypothetical protein